MKKTIVLLLSGLCFCLLSACNTVTSEHSETCKHEVGHDGVCAVCQEYIPTDGVVYQISADGKSAEVCGYDGTDTFVVIAQEYNRLPVTTIKSGSFDDQIHITHVLISDSVLCIEDHAFSNCDNLIRIVLGENMTTIHDFAFSACFKLVEIYNKSQITITESSAENGNIGLYAKNIYTTPQNSKLSTDENGYVIYTDGENKEIVAYLGTETNLVIPLGITKINSYAFHNNDRLTNIVIGNQVTVIGEHAFAGCDSLQSVVVGDSVYSIEREAFYFCKNLKELTIGKALTSIGEWAFSNCKLTNIAVHEDNVSYASVDGNLYSKNKETLLQYAIGKTETTFTVPDHVTVIARGAFRYCENLTSVIIGDSVLSLNNWSFSDCSNLKTVDIGSRVNFIADSAFEKTQLLHIAVDENNSEYTSENGNLYSITNGDKNLEWYAAGNSTEIFVLPEDVYCVFRYAFSNCNNLTKIVIGDNVSRICEYAFSSCENLTSVEIGSSVAIIDENAFFQCENLISITVDENNPFFTVINGDLYTTDGELIFAIK